MAKEWILDVLVDLKAFSRHNGLTALAEQLDDTILVAAAHLASLEKSAGSTGVDGNEAGEFPGTTATGDIP